MNTEPTRYEVLSPIKHSGTFYPIGSSVLLSDDDAKFLLLAKCVRVAVPAAAPAPQAPEPQALEPQVPSAEPAPAPADQDQDQEPSAEEPADGQEPEPADSQDPAGEAPDYSRFTKAELNAELDARGIEHDTGALNADLRELLIADDAAKASADSDAQG